MIPVEPYRFTPLSLKSGDVVTNELAQKFKVKLNSEKLVLLEPYEGKKPAIQLCFMGELPKPE